MCVILVNGICSFYAGDNNVGGVIGGVFGGLAIILLLAVVTVVIVVFILKLKRRYSKMIINYY